MNFRAVSDVTLGCDRFQNAICRSQMCGIGVIELSFRFVMVNKSLTIECVNSSIALAEFSAWAARQVT